MEDQPLPPLPEEGPFLVTIVRDQQSFGPYTIPDIQRYVRSGHIALSDKALPPGAEAQVPLTEVPGLEQIGDFAPPPPPPKPPPSPSQRAPGPARDPYVAPVAESEESGDGCLHVIAFLCPCLGIFCLGYFLSKGRTKAAGASAISIGAGFLFAFLLRFAIIASSR